jgi:hypothetical protein
MRVRAGESCWLSSEGWDAGTTAVGGGLSPGTGSPVEIEGKVTSSWVRSWVSWAGTVRCDGVGDFEGVLLTDLDVVRKMSGLRDGDTGGIFREALFIATLPFRRLLCVGNFGFLGSSRTETGGSVDSGFSRVVCCVLSNSAANSVASSTGGNPTWVCLGDSHSSL